MPRGVGGVGQRWPDEPGWPATRAGADPAAGSDAVSNQIEITVRGWVANAPRLLERPGRQAMMTMRLGSTPRRYDAEQGWVNGGTEWFSVLAFRDLAGNAARSLRKGDPVLVHGRLRLTRSAYQGKEYVSNEIVADAIGPDLGFGTTLFARAGRRERDGLDGDRPLGAGVVGPDDDGAEHPGVGGPGLGGTGYAAPEAEDRAAEDRAAEEWDEDEDLGARFEEEIADLEDSFPAG